MVGPVVVRNSAKGYDIFIQNTNASVQDYLDAFNRAIAILPFERTRQQSQSCYGCDRCCAERAPLTAIDCLALKKAVGERNLDTFLDRFTTVIVKGPVVDIILKQDDNGRCIFLNHKKKTCRIYNVRPFVCQTFICSPASRRALALREAVVNKGEDELVRLWFRTNMIIHQAEDPCPDPKDWPPTPFTGKTRYSEVLLREVLPAQLFTLGYEKAHGGRKTEKEG